MSGPPEEKPSTGPLGSDTDEVQLITAVKVLAYSTLAIAIILCLHLIWKIWKYCQANTDEQIETNTAVYGHKPKLLPPPPQTLNGDHHHHHQNGIEPGMTVIELDENRTAINGYVPNEYIGNGTNLNRKKSVSVAISTISDDI